MKHLLHIILPGEIKVNVISRIMERAKPHCAPGDSAARRRKSRELLPLGLRAKLFIGFVIFNLLMAPLLAVVTYRTASAKFIREFTDHKLSIARVLSSAINGDIHRTLTTPESVNLPEYRRYLDLMSRIQKKETDIRYIFTVNYRKADGRLYYAIDGNIPEHDTIWFETNEFAFELFIDDDGRMKIEYDSVIRDRDFTVHTPIGAVKVGIESVPARHRMLINGVPMITVITVDPLSARTPHGMISSEEYLTEGPIRVNGRTRTLTVSFTGKNKPSSWPGSEFIESKEEQEFVKELISKKEESVEREAFKSAYGSFYSAHSPILSSSGEAIGMLTLSVSSGEVEQYRKSILIASVLLFIAALALSSVLTLYLSRLFTGPLSRLMDGVNALAGGDMNALVDIRSGDEIGRLAERFNEMAAGLKSASGEQERLISEIRQLNESLERRVEERTHTIKEQSDELNRQIMMARRIQMSLLPVRVPDSGSVAISFKYEPMMAVGGDFIDFHSSGREIMLFICDVSGHGVPAAFLSAMVKMSLPSCYEAGGRTALAVKRLHDSLTGKMGGHFLSAVFCHIDEATGTMTCSNAGHPPVIVARADGSVEHATAAGKIITEGFPPRAGETTVHLAPGDKLVLYTDGVTEARGHDLVMYGEERLEELVRQNAAQPAAELCENIYRSVLLHVGATEHDFEDDLTLMVAEYTG